jgi:hypothetical protein
MYTVYNARVQLIATAVNNVGVGSILAGIVAPAVNGTVGDLTHIMLWLVLGADLIALAQLILGGLYEL